MNRMITCLGIAALLSFASIPGFAQSGPPNIETSPSAETDAAAMESAPPRVFLTTGLVPLSYGLAGIGSLGGLGGLGGLGSSLSSISSATIGVGVEFLERRLIVGIDGMIDYSKNEVMGDNDTRYPLPGSYTSLGWSVGASIRYNILPPQAGSIIPTVRGRVFVGGWNTKADLDTVEGSEDDDDPTGFYFDDYEITGVRYGASVGFGAEYLFNDYLGLGTELGLTYTHASGTEKNDETENNTENDSLDTYLAFYLSFRI